MSRRIRDRHTADRRRTGRLIRPVFVLVMSIALANASVALHPADQSLAGIETVASEPITAVAYRRAAPGGETPVESLPSAVTAAGMADLGAANDQAVDPEPVESSMTRAPGKAVDLRSLHGVVVRRERPERPAPGEVESEAEAESETEAEAAAAVTALPEAITPQQIAAALAPAPAPASSFEGLDYANWGAGHPGDVNGDVGPTYYIQAMNTAVGIFDKTTGTRVAAFTFNALMSQGNFGNLCDTDNDGDPVVLYDSFEDRWVLTDFAFRTVGGSVSPETVYQCFAVSKSGNPVTGGWNFYSILSPNGLSDFGKFAVWPDGIYMAANMFGYAAGSPFIAPHVWALNKAQMYAGAPQVSVVDFETPPDFTLLPANARLQSGTPALGSPEYFLATSSYLNAVSVYEMDVDWDRISTSTFTGPTAVVTDTSWPNSSPPEALTPANSLDVVGGRAMAQAQYSNIGGTESLWVSHTVRRADTSGVAAPRWYQLDVTGGNLAPTAVQAATWDPDGANTSARFIPSIAIDRVGDLALGYTRSNATTNPELDYAGRLVGDAVNTFSQGERTLVVGTGTQSGSCGGTCVRWGDYSAMALDPDGCTFWQTGSYYQVTGLNFRTRIGSFRFPGCTTSGNGTLAGTVTDGVNPIGGATVALGSRVTTSDASGRYSFTVPAGTYQQVTATRGGFETGSATTVAVAAGSTLTRDFSLAASATSGCFTDAGQSVFQLGVPTGCSLTANPGVVSLQSALAIDQQNATVTVSGFGITTTSWVAQTFTAGVNGVLAKADLDLFCSGCTGTSPQLLVTVRATTGSPAVPTGPDLATATIDGFTTGFGGSFTADFSAPGATTTTLTAGSVYALIVHPVSNPSVGLYAYVCSCTYPDSNPYTAGQRVTSANSGATWTADTTVGGRDLGFTIWYQSGYAPAGTLESSVKDANPAANRAVDWTTLSFTASTPTGTSVKFQVAASNNRYGPFVYVGPDTTAATYFTTTGASLSQFDGFRYLRYKAYLASIDPSVSPLLSSAVFCFQDVLVAAATALVADAATATYGTSTSLSATLVSGGGPAVGQSVSFTLNDTPVGAATTNASGVATLASVSVAGISGGAYPAGVAVSFAGTPSLDATSDTASLTVDPAGQSISVTTNAPGSAAVNTTFVVAATGGASGNPVVFSSAGSCTNSGSTFTMTAATGACSVRYDQAGSGNYSAAARVAEPVTATAGIPDVASDYVSFTPARLADTRNEPGLTTIDGQFLAGGIRSARSTLELQVTGRATVPTDASAVVLNVAVTGSDRDGFITVFPCGAARPNASNLNFAAGQTTSNLVVAGVGTGGKVCIFTLADVHLIVDVNGDYPALTSYRPVVPARLADTRNEPGLTTIDGQFLAGGIRSARSTLELQVTGRATVPADASAVVLNIAVTGSDRGGFITVFPCGAARPNASNLNFAAGQTTSNLVVAGVGAGGKVCLFTMVDVHLIVDLNGDYPALTSYQPVVPARLADTRNEPGLTTIDGQFLAGGIRSARSTLELQVTGRAAVPAGASAVVLNIAVTGSDRGGFITVFPCGAARPNASNLNFAAGQTTSNLVVAGVGTGGRVCLFTMSDVHLIVDLAGAYPASGPL